jgi:predicted small secreted protein
MKKKNLKFTRMKRWFAAIYTGLAIMISLAGCTKDGAGGDVDGGGGNSSHLNNPSDTIPPVVKIDTPVADQVYTTGSVINVTGKVTDGDGLYRGSIRITNNVNDVVLKEQLYEIHGILQYDFNVSYTASVTVVSDYTVTVSFEDHGQNITSLSAKVKVNP